MRRAAWSALLALVLVSSAGCSLVGLGIGSLTNRSGPQYTGRFKPSELSHTSKGATVRLHLTDGSELVGRFAGWSREGNEYARRYGAWKDSLADSTDVPDLDERLQVVDRQGRIHRGTFRGFWNGGVFLDPPRGTFPDLVAMDEMAHWAVDRPGEDAAHPVPLLVVTSVKPELAIRVRTRNGMRDVATDRIESIETAPPRHGARNGLLIGLGMDLVLLGLSVLLLLAMGDAMR
jgi:hypothetical protein